MSALLSLPSACPDPDGARPSTRGCSTNQPRILSPAFRLCAAVGTGNAPHILDWLERTRQASTVNVSCVPPLPEF